MGRHALTFALPIAEPATEQELQRTLTLIQKLRGGLRWSPKTVKREQEVIQQLAALRLEQTNPQPQ